MIFRQLKCKHCLSFTLLVCTATFISYLSINKDGRKFVNDQLTRLERDSVDLSSLLTSTRVNLTELKNDNDQLRMKIKEMRDLIHAKTHILEDLKIKHTELEKQLTTAEEQNADLHFSVEKLNSQIHMKDDQISMLTESNEESREEVNRQQKHISKIEKDMVKIKSESQALKMHGAEIDTQLHNELTLAHNEYATIKDKLVQRENDYNNLKSENDKQHLNSQKLRGQVDDFKRSMASMKAKFEDRDKKMRDMKTHYLNEEKQLSELKLKLESETENEAKIQQERDRYLGLVDSEKELNKQLLTDLESQKNKANVWEDEAESIAKKLESVESSIQTYFNKAHGLKAEIQRLNDKRKIAVDHVVENKKKVAEAVQHAVLKAEANLENAI